MTGIYLRCDGCGATLGGEQVSPRPQGLGWADEAALRARARELGWTGPLTRSSGTDLCPGCSELAHASAR